MSGYGVERERQEEGENFGTVLNERLYCPPHLISSYLTSSDIKCAVTRPSSTGCDV